MKTDGASVDTMELRGYAYHQPTTDYNYNKNVANGALSSQADKSNGPKNCIVHACPDNDDKHIHNHVAVNNNVKTTQNKIHSKPSSITNQIHGNQRRENVIFDSDVTETANHPMEDAETGNEIETGNTRMSTWSLSSTQFFFINPYNVRNYRFTRTLRLQGWLMYVLICLYPGVKYMESSDYLYMKGRHKRARQYANLSTALFVLGILVMVTLVAFLLFFVVYFST